MRIFVFSTLLLNHRRGWSGSAMMLGKPPVSGRPANLVNSRARDCCVCSRFGWRLFGHFFSRLLFLSSFSLSLGDCLIYTEILSERAIKPKPSKQPNHRTLKNKLMGKF